MTTEDPHEAAAAVTAGDAAASDAFQWADEAYLLLAELEGPDSAAAARAYARRKKAGSV